MKHNKGNYRDIEDLSWDEEKRLYHLERMVREYEEISEKIHRRWKQYTKELEEYKKEIGIA